MSNVWQTLSRIDCSDHIEQKNGMSYVSWAWAWMMFKQSFPQATFLKSVFEDNDGKCLPFMRYDQGYTYVEVTVYIDDDKATEVMPVLDHRNKAMQNPDGFAVNKAHQRCLVKALAYLGLGVTIYAGEDLPLGAMEDIENDVTRKFMDAKSVDEIDAAWRDQSPSINQLTKSSKDRVISAFKKKKRELQAA